VVKSSPAAIADALYDFYTAQRGPAFSACVAEEKKKYEWSTMTATVHRLLGKLRA
jgi:hypothetical protein